MILSDTDIRREIELGNILVKSAYGDACIKTNGIDLTLGDSLTQYNEDVLDAKLFNGYNTIIIPEEGFVLMPNQLYLGYVAEYTECKSNIVPFLEGKSSIGRLGISVHLTAGIGDIGFRGYWTLEITAVQPVRIYAGMPICQLLFMYAKSMPRLDYSQKKSSKYIGQPPFGIASRMHENFDAKSGTWKNNFS